MGKPRLIILIRHAQSEGNKNRDIHQLIPDHRVKLTPEGQAQALEAGRKLRSLLRPDDTLHVFTSPYRRTRETTEGILTSLTSDDPSPSPFHRNTIKVYEEPRLREQDFGNFQPCSAEMERMWQERADYGHFFYRIPNGESAADAYDRVSHFNDSLWRRFNENNFASVCILVTHGLMTRVFLMKWYHFSVEYFEDLRNVNHCEFVVMRQNTDNGKFILQNHLRTWSELKRERIARGSISLHAASKPGIGDSPIPIRRKWGGCPEGCTHSKHAHNQTSITQREPLRMPKRQNTADLFRDDDVIPKTSPGERLSRQSSLRKVLAAANQAPNLVHDRYPPQAGTSDNGDETPTSHNTSLSDGEDTVLDQDPDKHDAQSRKPDLTLRGRLPHPYGSTRLAHSNVKAAHNLSSNPTSVEEMVFSPDGTPNYVNLTSSGQLPAEKSMNERITRRMLSPRGRALLTMGGRDGGGSKSGGASPLGSEDDETGAGYDELADMEEAVDGSTIGTPSLNPTRSTDSQQSWSPAPTSTSAVSPIMTSKSKSSLSKALHGNFSQDGLEKRNSRMLLADALGDQSEVESDPEEVEDDKRRMDGEMQKLLEQEKKDRSLRGSVY